MSAAPSSHRRVLRTTLIGGLVLLAGVFATLLVLAPIEIRSAWALELLEARAGAAAGGRFSCGRVLLSLWPRLGITLESVEIAREDLTASAETLILLPRLLPLLRGSFQAAAVQVQAPDLRTVAPLFPRGAAAAAPGPGLRAAGEALSQLLARLPETDLELAAGRLQIAVTEEVTLEIAALKAHLTPGGGRLQAALSCRSNLWQHLDLTADLAASPLAGSVALALTDFEPAALLAALYPDSPVEVVEGRLTLQLTLSPQGLDRLEGRVKGSVPQLTLRRNSRETDLSIAAFAADVETGPGRLAVSVSELDLKRPAAAGAMNLVYDEQASPRIAIGIEGRSVDVDAVRRTALVLLSALRETAEIFDVLRGGFVPWITVTLAGDTPADLDELAHIEIRGRLEQGRLFIPGVGLDLEEVSGEVRIAGGILEGSGLDARYRKTLAAGGSLRLGLAGKDPLLELSVPMAADLEPLPEILARVVRDRDFRAELAGLEQFAGSARGRLDLAGTTAAVKVRVEAADIDLRARHRRIALPIAVTGGRILYDESGIALEEADLRLGGSHIPRLSARLVLDPVPVLQASAPAADLNLAELPRRIEAVALPSWIDSLEGRLRIEPWSFAGLPAAPGSWELHGAGVVQELRLTSGGLPEPVSLAKASWSCRGRRLSIESGEATMGASRLQALAGGFDWSDGPRLEITDGRIAADVSDLVRLLSPHIDLQAHLGPLAPLSGAIVLAGLQGRMRFPAEGVHAPDFSAALEQGAIRSALLPAELVVRGGDLRWRQGRFELRHLDAGLAQSGIRGAELEIDRGRQEELRFRADSLHIECGEIYPWLARLPALAALRREIADMRGSADLSALLVRGNMTAPQQWEVQGDAVLNHVEITTTFLKEPLRIRNGRVRVGPGPGPPETGPTVRIEDFQAALGATRVLAAGEIRTAAETAALDLSVTAESIVWDEISALADHFAARDTGVRREFTGRVALRADYLSLMGQEFQPVVARILLDPGRTRVEVERAGLCGIVVIGRADIAGGRIDALLVPVADNTLLDRTVSCLTREKSVATGQFNIDGMVVGRGLTADWLNAMTGRLQFISENGRILRSTLLARILSLLNITEIYRGRVPDLTGDGVEYKRMQISAELLNGRVLVHSWTVDGPSLWLGARGSIDLTDETLQLFIGVSPFTTFDRIIRSVPLLGYVLGGRLVAIPIQARGSIADPEVVPMHPAAVGQSLVEMAERALLLPVHIIQPLIPDAEESAGARGSGVVRE